MNDDSQIWAGKLKDYNEVDRSKPLTMLALSKIIKLIYVEIAKYKDTEEVEGVTQKAFEAYWKALAELFPKMFNSENSQTYNIQKSGPATIMTKILRLIIIQKYHIKSEHSKDLSLVEAKSYKKILKFLRDYKIEKKVVWNSL